MSVGNLLHADTVDAFERDGYVVVPGVLTDAELERFAVATDGAVATRKRSDTRAVEQKSRYEQSFVQCINLWEDHPEVRALTFHPRVAHLAAELLRTPAVRLWHDQALYKEPGGRITDAHQDQPYWPIAEPDTVTAWVPFDGSTIESGAMGYLPGSHRVGVRRFVNIFGADDPENLLEHGDFAKITPVYVEVPRGGVAFHHGYTVHTAHPNQGAAMRRVHTMIYFRDGCTRGSPAFHFSVDRPGIAVGDPIRSDVTPIAWPRSENDLPEPPAPIAAELRELLPPGLVADAPQDA